MNERLDGKTDITFELRMVENLRRSIKRKNGIVHMYGTVYVIVHDTVHINGSMTWHGPMIWH